MHWYYRALQLDPNLPLVHNVLGNILKSKGEYQEAKEHYNQAVHIKPDFSVAWSNLAGLHKEEGHLHLALEMYQRAVTLAPDFADAFSNMGTVLKELGHAEEAAHSFARAIELRPTFAAAHNNIGTIFHDRGDLESAIRSYLTAVKLDPQFTDAYSNLANAYLQSRRLDKAMAAYLRALELNPKHPHALNNLGNVLKERGFVREALTCYQQAIKVCPGFAAAHNNLGSLMKEHGRPHAAIESYQKAIQLDPNFADAYSNMGNVHKELGQVDEAIRLYQVAIEKRPDFADAHSNLGSAYKDLNRLGESIACYRRALELKPDFPDAFSNLVHCLLSTCDWTDIDRRFERLSQIVETQITNGRSCSVQPFHAIVYPFSTELSLLLARFYARKAVPYFADLGEEVRHPPRTRVPRPPKPDRALLRAEGPLTSWAAEHPDEEIPPTAPRIHVGYVSSDFGDHPLSHLMQSVFGLHNRRHFKITAYALSPSDQSEWRRRIETGAERFVDLSHCSTEEAVRRISGDGVHILINLNGFTKGARNDIFALRPAPLAMMVLGYPSTTGAEWIDYFVTDERVTPQELQGAFSEELIRMPDTYFINDHRQSFPDLFDDPDSLPTRREFGLPEDKIVLCNFNQLYKCDPQTLNMWCEILTAVPHAVLWLLRFPEDGEANIVKEAKRRGIVNRIHFTDVAPKRTHIARGILADLFLDTRVCNAHTTGCDALWAGLPVLTFPGEKMCSRVAGSLCHAVGCPELIATSADEYVSKAVSWCTPDRPAIKPQDLGTPRPRYFTPTSHLCSREYRDLRKRLWAQRWTAPLFNTKRWVLCFEQALWYAWDLHCQERPPCGFAVEPLCQRQEGDALDE